ncbi:rCG24838, isoform CRA_a [Rattus norvegicus]|uniref:RCG24838, isoform CRA_a n=1 Tax=Rattus norvegicus TaxID=10116 RepID=A6JCG5_RAT|nr:rCG24838, isoform CRA_a [Rattus norvegicus]EDM08693.1 rCG24838, isoform CRA_a [Rattus norvegicus]
MYYLNTQSSCFHAWISQRLCSHNYALDVCNSSGENTSP